MRLIELYESRLNEIQRLHKYDYEGGKDELEGYKSPKNKALKPLPGGSGLEYTTRKDGHRTYIFIVDPNAKSSKPELGPVERWGDFLKRSRDWEKNQNKSQPAIVAKLSVSPVDAPIPNAVQVSSITVDEDYRGKGLAKALYGIVLTIMGKTLVAGSEQTPGGRKNWVGLTNIPGVEVKGFVQIDADEVNYDPRNNSSDSGPFSSYGDGSSASEADVDKNHDMLMRLGGQFIAKNKWSEFWAFDVVPGRAELKPAIRTALNQLYDEWQHGNGLYARWVG